MKKTLLILAIASVIFASCSDDEGGVPDPNLKSTDTEAVLDEEEAQSVFESIEEIGNNALTEAFAGISGGRYLGNFMNCAEIDLDIVDQTITIDFGENCEGPRGRMRSGKIIISFSARHHEPGAIVTTTFENFVVDGLKIEGIRTVTNLSTSTNENPSFNVKIENGKVTWPDGTFATRTVDRTKTWIRTNTPITDEYLITGTAEGVNRNGKTYKSTITETVVFKVSCIDDRIFIPVAGTKDIEVDGELKVTVDYGDGTCDSIITIKKGGNSIDIDVNDARQG